METSLIKNKLSSFFDIYFVTQVVQYLYPINYNNKPAYIQFIQEPIHNTLLR
jgi:hypothetical protein